MNTGFFFSILCTIFFVAFMKTLYSKGKFENKCLRMIVEPFMFLFRLAATCTWAYFVVWKLLIYGWIIGTICACNLNWWANKSDSWITNASYFNAFMSWPVFFIGCITIFYIGILSPMLILMAFIKPDVRRMLLGLPKKLMLFLIGLDSYQFDNPVDSYKNKVCPMCGEKFTIDSKFGEMLGCSSSLKHWYHRACLSKKLQDTPKVNGEIMCEYKNCPDPKNIIG